MTLVGVHPTERCGELDSYILNLRQFVEAETDKATADQLTRWLQWVGDAPGLAKIDVERTVIHESKPKWGKAARFEQAEAIRRIGGMIRGAANLLRV